MPSRPVTSPLHPVTCEGCDASIWFAATPNHKAMPVDAAAAAGGNVAVYCDDRGTWHARVLKDGEQPAAYEKRHHTHFTTCDHPEAFRRRQRRKLAAPAVREPGQPHQPALFPAHPTQEETP